MKRVLWWVGCLVAGGLLGSVTAALGINGWVVVAVIVGGGLLFALADYLDHRSALASLEAVRLWRRAIAASARATLASLEPPLAEEHYRAAFRRLCRAIAAGRRRVRLVAGDRTIEVNLAG